MEHPPIGMLCPSCMEAQEAQVEFSSDVPSEDPNYSYQFTFDIKLACGLHQTGTLRWRGLDAPDFVARLRATHWMIMNRFQERHPNRLPLHIVDANEWSGPNALHNN